MCFCVEDVVFVLLSQKTEFVGSSSLNFEFRPEVRKAIRRIDLSRLGNIPFWRDRRILRRSCQNTQMGQVSSRKPPKPIERPGPWC